MDSLFIIFVAQAILCILVFLFIYRSAKKNAELKEEIKHIKEVLGKREVN
jgi:steroid 5-alpha reductase family enzyme